MTFFAMNVNESKNFFSKYYFISIHILTKVPVKIQNAGAFRSVPILMLIALTKSIETN